MSKIQQPRAVSNSATPKDPQIPNGWAKVPHSVARDSTLTMQARLLWVILEGRQGQHTHARVSLKVLAADMGASKSSVKRWLIELTQAGLLTIKHTGRTSMYTALKQVERARQRPIRELTGEPSTEQETLRKKKAGQPPIGLALVCLTDSPREPQGTTAPRRKQIELFLNTAGQHFPQIPGVTRKVSKALGTLFGMGWQSPELIAELQKSITNPQAGAGLFVTELERLAAIPRQESYTATHTATKAEHQYEELEEVWGQGTPQEQTDQFEENSQEWIATIRADLNQRNREKIS
jgi:hypothetical protein